MKYVSVWEIGVSKPYENAIPLPTKMHNNAYDVTKHFYIAQDSLYINPNSNTAMKNESGHTPFPLIMYPKNYSPTLLWHGKAPFARNRRSPSLDPIS